MDQIKASAPSVGKPKLLQVRHLLQTRRDSIRTDRAYRDWMRRFIVFQGKRHPAEMGEVEIADFLSYLAVERKVAPATAEPGVERVAVSLREVFRAEAGTV